MKKLYFALAAATVMLASSAHAGDTIRLCTGGAGGIYHAAGEQIAKMVGPNIQIEVVESAGTIENMDRLTDVAATDPMACDAMIGQPDGPVYLKRTAPGKADKVRQAGPTLHREYLQVLCNKESGISDLSKLTKANKVAIGPAGSGAWLVWQNFIAEDDSYQDIPTTDEEKDAGLSAVSSGETTCMIVSAALKNPTVVEADTNYGDTIALVPATDYDFNDAQDVKGKPLYSFEDIPSGTYPNSLQTGLFGSSIETVSWNANVYVNPDRVTGNELNAFIKAIARAAGPIRASYGK